MREARYKWKRCQSHFGVCGLLARSYQLARDKTSISSIKQNRGLQLIQEVQDLLNSKQFQPKVRRTPLYRRNSTKRNSQVDRPATPCPRSAAIVDQKTPRLRRSRRSLVDCKPATQSNNFPVAKVPPRYRSLNTGCMPHGAALASQAYEEAKLQSSNVESQDRGQANACSALTAPSNFAPCNQGLRKMRSKSCNPGKPCCPSAPCNQGQSCCPPCDRGVVQIPKPKMICNEMWKSPCAKPTPKCEGRCRMAYVQPPIPESFKPKRGYCPPTIPIAWDTVYTMSYPAQPMCGRAAQIRPENNLQASGCFSDETTQAHDYRGCYGEPAKRIWPCSSLQVGQGPMQDLTTFRHDYVPKFVDRLDPIVPIPELLTSDKPMEGDTTMTASYRPPGCVERVTSFKPVLCYKQPDMPFIGDTIHRLSYVPQPLCEKEFFPWQQKPTYKCPEVEVEGNTIYKASFRAPGRFVPCGTCPPCNECCPDAKQDCCKATCFDPCCPGVC